MWWPFRKKKAEPEAAIEAEDLLPDISVEVAEGTRRVTKTLSDCRALSAAAATDLEETAEVVAKSAASTAKSYQTLRSGGENMSDKAAV